jgi:hypothetical protein
MYPIPLKPWVAVTFCLLLALVGVLLLTGVVTAKGGDRGIGWAPIVGGVVLALVVGFKSRRDRSSGAA